MKSQIIEQFTQAMAADGVLIKEPLIADGKIHRYHAEGDRLGSKNAAVILHLDGNPAGFYQHFKTGVVRTWRADGKPQRLSEAVKQQIELARQQRQQETIQRQQKSAKTANYLWQQAERLTLQTHPYLIRKHIQPHGLRVNQDGVLLVPIRDCSGLVSLQFISPDGSKRFLTGGRLKGCFAKIGNHQPDRPIRICEGWATAASVHQCTGDLTLAAMSAGNLVEVAKLVRQKRPDAEIIIMGDNDESGKGQEAARKAALAVGGKYMIPPTVGHDWNDHINAGGKA